MVLQDFFVLRSSRLLDEDPDFIVVFSVLLRTGLDDRPLACKATQLINVLMH